MKKKILLLLMSLALFTTLLSQDEQWNKTQRFITESGEAYLKIQYNPILIEKLNPYVSFDKKDGNDVFLYVNQSGFNKLVEENVSYELQTHPGDMYQATMYTGEEKGAYEFNAYPTYTVYLEMMAKYQTDYPRRCQIVDFGRTVKNRKLLIAKISSDITKEAPKPRFYYSSSIHGDEITGYVMMLRLMDYLLRNYGTNAEVTKLMDSVEIWITPLANPDGTYNTGNTSVTGARRGNGNNIDLNRNFKDFTAGDHPDGKSWQPENIATMDLLDSISFTLSANFHGGAEVVNYPWDGIYTLHADDAWWSYVSRNFATSAQNNSPFGYMTAEDDGITNGAAWYVITGGRQDYVNYYGYCREFTLEVSDTKLLPENQLDAHWGYLKQAMLDYIEEAMYGIHGTIKDSVTLEPLEAKFEILNHDNRNSHVFSELPFGDYHRPIYAGTYEVKVTADGYRPKTIKNVQVQNGQQTRLNVLLPSIYTTTDNADVQTKIELFPNPTTDLVYITNINNQDIKVFDLMGKEILNYQKSQSNEGETILNVSSLSPGLYLIKISDLASNRQLSFVKN